MRGGGEKVAGPCAQPSSSMMDFECVWLEIIDHWHVCMYAHLLIIFTCTQVQAQTSMEDNKGKEGTERKEGEGKHDDADERGGKCLCVCVYSSVCM